MVFLRTWRYISQTANDRRRSQGELFHIVTLLPILGWTWARACTRHCPYDPKNAVPSSTQRRAPSSSASSPLTSSMPPSSSSQASAISNVGAFFPTHPAALPLPRLHRGPCPDGQRPCRRLQHRLRLKVDFLTLLAVTVLGHAPAA